MYNIKNNENLFFLGNLFKTVQHSIVTRTVTNNLLVLPFKKTDLGQRILRFHGVKIWNSIPLHIRNIQNIGRFKALVKSFVSVESG